MRYVVFSFTVLFAALFSMPANAGCPDGFTEVPATSPYTGQAYCVMEREAVNPATGEPWNYISQFNATTVCEVLAPQGDLMVNAVWQALVRQAEGVDGNWSGNSIGSGSLETDLTINSGNSTFYDIGDGLWEFVIGWGPADFTAVDVHLFQTGSDPNLNETWTTNGLNGNDQFHYGPDGTGYSSSNALGVTTNRASQYIMRGGDDSEPGAFGAAMNHAGNSASDAGFRCSCPKAWCGQ